MRPTYQPVADPLAPQAASARQPVRTTLLIGFYIALLSAVLVFSAETVVSLIPSIEVGAPASNVSSVVAPNAGSPLGQTAHTE